MSKTLSSAPAPYHTHTISPMIMDPFEPEMDLRKWLNCFYDVPYRHDLECSCCSWPPQTPNKTERYLTYTNDEEDKLIPLPCGCNFRRPCILTKLKPLLDETTDVKCPSCNTVLLRHWVVARVLKWCEAAETEALKGDGKCCLVCREDLESGDGGASSESDTSMKLPCGHVFHRDCLIRWLSPAPKGGHGNACPICRMELFGKYPPIENFLRSEDDSEEGGEAGSEDEVLQDSSDRMVAGYDDDYEDEDENAHGDDEEGEEEEEEDDGDEYDELRYWHMAYGIPEFLEEHEQLMQRLKFLDDPTQLVYRERMEQLERYMILGDWIRQRNKALGIAPEDDHYVPLFPVLEGPENSINLSMFR